MKHIIWIDYAKSIAIFLVVLLHTHCSETLAQVINSFIIPLFFMMSGYLFSYRRNPAYGPFIYKRFRQLVVPYLWIGALGYLAWLLVLRHYGSDAGSDQSWYEPLIGILGGFADLMTTDIPLWFLLSLFVVEAVSYPQPKDRQPPADRLRGFSAQFSALRDCSAAPEPASFSSRPRHLWNILLFGRTIPQPAPVRRTAAVQPDSGSRRAAGIHGRHIFQPARRILCLRLRQLRTVSAVVVRG